MYEALEEPLRDNICLENGETAYPVASLRNVAVGNEAHFIIDDGCYVLVHDAREDGVFRKSPWIFPEAAEVLRRLPRLGEKRVQELPEEPALTEREQRARDERDMAFALLRRWLSVRAEEKQAHRKELAERGVPGQGDLVRRSAVRRLLEADPLPFGDGWAQGLERLRAQVDELPGVPEENRQKLHALAYMFATRLSGLVECTGPVHPSAGPCTACRARSFAREVARNALERAVGRSERVVLEQRASMEAPCLDGPGGSSSDGK